MREVHHKENVTCCCGREFGNKEERDKHHMQKKNSAERKEKKYEKLYAIVKELQKTVKQQLETHKPKSKKQKDI